MAIEDSYSREENARWSNAFVQPISEEWSVQIAGLGPLVSGEAGHTCFARLVVRKGHPSPRKTDPDTSTERQITLPMIVQNVLLAAVRLDAIKECPGILVKDKNKALLASDSFAGAAIELLQIGAIWRLPTFQDSESIKHEKTKWKRKPCRIKVENTKNLSLSELKSTILRIHYGASRFLDVYRYDWGKCFDEGMGKPLALNSSCHFDTDLDSDSHKSVRGKQGVIIHEDLQLGYAIVNKPPGVPVHGYVYNNVENVAYMYGESLAARYPNEELAAARISVPQRLDTETSGVLVVAIKPSFSSYIGKMLQAKTLSHVHGTPSGKPSDKSFDISKRYKCLVCVKSLDCLKKLEDLACTGELVTHYLSSKRSIPRIFADSPSSLNEDDSSWMRCQMRIRSLGFHHTEDEDKFMLLQGCEDSKELALRLWGENAYQGKSEISIGQCIPYIAVAQVEVELLTGRTHQIRGQMAKLGFPLVGDKLYGGGSATSQKLGLHCCWLSFPNPIVVLGEGKGRPIRLQPSSEFLSYRCNRAWWHEFIDSE